MKSIVITRNNELQMIETDLPQIKDEDLLIKSLRTGLCSTERELFEQEISPPHGSDFLILGHEAVGEVAEVGSKVTQFKKGDIVVPSVRRECGECHFCSNGRTDMCSTGKYTERGILKLHGFMSEYFVEKEAYLTKIPENLRSQAVLLEPFTIGIKAFEEYFKIQKSRLSVGQDILEKEMLNSVLIIGAGPIGLLTALVAVRYNINLICLDIDEEGGVKSILTDMLTTAPGDTVWFGRRWIPPERGRERLTLDTPEDYDFLSCLYGELLPREIPLLERGYPVAEGRTA